MEQQEQYGNRLRRNNFFSSVVRSECIPSLPPLSPKMLFLQTLFVIIGAERDTSWGWVDSLLSQMDSPFFESTHSRLPLTGGID